MLCNMFCHHLLQRASSCVLLANINKSAQKPLSVLGARFKHSMVNLKGQPEIHVNGVTYKTSELTNMTEKIISKVGVNLHRKKQHPLNLISKRIQSYFYKTFPSTLVSGSTSPMFTVIDNLGPVVTLQQNFDSLLVPPDHISRSPRDTYYINDEYLLRAHTSAHQAEVIKMGLDAFLIIGDVYRRDEIDSSHYPVFHQMEGMRLFPKKDLFQNDSEGEIFENGKRCPRKQKYHTDDAAKMVEADLKHTLFKLAQGLFGKDVETRWVEEYFPFTHPSFELEVKFQGKWMEVLGCGIVEQEILHNAGVGNKIGWAFGLGLERLAMILYRIPDVRLFWSNDSGFLSQFNVEDPSTSITYEPVSSFPQCVNDISFWVSDDFCENDFFDLVRNIGGELVEQVTKFDTFYHPKKLRESHSYRITYRHMERTLTQEEVNTVHDSIGQTAVDELGVEIR